MIAAGASTLISAPTGAGKTLAAFMWAIDRLLAEVAERDPGEAGTTKVVYVSPLKALGYDIERNLSLPLASIEGGEHVRVGVRSGDTPQRERQAMLRKPPDILITTPESLYLMLTSRARETLADVECVIVDEIHAVAGSKRGSHLALTLERLERLGQPAGPIQRIGLSATQRPIGEIARFLGGVEQPAGEPRPVTVVESPMDKPLDLQVVVPVADLRDPETDPAAEPGLGEQGDSASRRSIWPSIYPRVLELVREHASTIVFVNNRRLAERLALRLNELAGEEIALSHHGSLSREAAPDRGTAEGGKDPLPGRDQLARARHRHGRARPGRADRVAEVGGARAAADRPRRSHAVGGLQGPPVPEVQGRPRRVRRRRQAHARASDRGHAHPSLAARRAGPADGRDGGDRGLDLTS